MHSTSTDSPAQIARKRFLKNIPAVIGLVFILLLALTSVFAYWVIPDDTENANFQALELARKSPGTKASILLLPGNTELHPTSAWTSWISGKKDVFIPLVLEEGTELEFHGDSIYFSAYAGYKDYKLIHSFISDLSQSHPLSLEYLEKSGRYYDLIGDVVHYYDNQGTAKTTSLQELQAAIIANNVLHRRFWLGTDLYGRDVFSRLLLGSRVSLAVGALAVVISLLIGVLLGSIAGFFRGWVDQVIMWIVSVVWSIPTLLLAISLSFVMQGGFTQVFLAIGLSMWVEVARIVRGQIFALREMQYVEATRALGYTSFRAIIVHILPNVVSPVIVIATANFAAAILIEAGLSFLGVGVQAPMPSWGGMIREGYSQIIFNTGLWLAVFPGLAIVLVVISLNLIGFGLRDAFDPKME